MREYDGSALHTGLKAHLPAGRTLLELGMGPGADDAFFMVARKRQQSPEK